MTTFQEALRQDITGNIAETALMYEQLLLAKDAPLAAYLNLATLYWECTDPGFNARHQLSDALFVLASTRYSTVLREAEYQFGYTSEIKFWNLYFAYVRLGDPPFDAECKALVSEPECGLVPLLLLIFIPGGATVLAAGGCVARHLQITADSQNRYIISVIEGTALRANTSVERWHDTRPRPLD